MFVYLLLASWTDNVSETERARTQRTTGIQYTRKRTDWSLCSFVGLLWVFCCCCTFHCSASLYGSAKESSVYQWNSCGAHTFSVAVNKSRRGDWLQFQVNFLAYKTIRKNTARIDEKKTSEKLLICLCFGNSVCVIFEWNSHVRWVIYGFCVVDYLSMFN